MFKSGGSYYSVAFCGVTFWNNCSRNRNNWAGVERAFNSGPLGLFRFANLHCNWPILIKVITFIYELTLPNPHVATNSEKAFWHHVEDDSVHRWSILWQYTQYTGFHQCFMLIRSRHLVCIRTILYERIRARQIWELHCGTVFYRYLDIHKSLNLQIRIFNCA